MISRMQRLLPAAKLLIVEDHPLYREGLVGLLLREVPQLTCCLADNAGEALATLRAHGDIDLVLCDLRLPGEMDGLALLAQVSKEFPTAARVLISGSDEALLPQQARYQNLMGYLPKSLPPSLWLRALSQILHGEPWFPNAPPVAPPPNERHVTILAQLARGMGNKDIGQALGITERTVKYHLREIYDRLGVANRAEAVARGAALGWIRLPGAMA